MILLLCQFVNYLEVTRLPVYYPSQQEKDYPKLYADNVRKLMAHEVCYSLIVLHKSVFENLNFSLMTYSASEGNIREDNSSN